MFEITREYWFSAAHRLEGHPKCGRLHGHNYKVVVSLTQNRNNIGERGWVLDYGIMDSVIKPIVDGLDHLYLVSQENITHNCPYYLVAAQRMHAVMLPVKRSTAELLAEFLYNLIQERLTEYGVYINYVEVDETPKSSAVYDED